MSFLLKKRKIKKVEKLAANLNDKTEYMKHKRNLKQSLISFKKVDRMIKFNQNTWIKAYIHMNPDQRKAKNDF